MSIIYKRNFVDLALIVAFSTSTVIIIDYWNILLQKDDLKLHVNTSDSSLLWKYWKVALQKKSSLLFSICQRTDTPEGIYYVETIWSPYA